MVTLLNGKGHHSKLCEQIFILVGIGDGVQRYGGGGGRGRMPRLSWVGLEDLQGFPLVTIYIMISEQS